MMSGRERIHEIIFEADTPAGKRFDVILLWCIVASILVVMGESVPEWHENVNKRDDSMYSVWPRLLHERSGFIFWVVSSLC